MCVRSYKVLVWHIIKINEHHMASCDECFRGFVRKMSIYVLARRSCFYPDFGISGYSEIRISGYPDIRTTGYPDIRTIGHPDIRISGHPDVQISGKSVVNKSRFRKWQDMQYMQHCGCFIGNE